VVKKGETLLGISKEVGVPLEDLARQNQITDVNLIYPGQEIRYTKPAPLPVETDISATEGLTIDPEGTTTAVEALTGRPVTKEPFTADVLKSMGADAVATSDEGTPSGQAMVADFESIPVDAPVSLTAEEVFPPEGDLDGDVVVEEPGDVDEKDLTITDQAEASAKNVAKTIIDSSSEESKPVIKDVFDEIDKLGFDPLAEADYEKIAKDINDRIEDYNINISTVASEKMKPTFEGWDKFMAVLGAAMGAYGSSMTGTPNFALKIVNQAIDRDTQAFLKSKEVRMKSLENQRMDLIMMRGEKLQMAQNRVTQLMQSETFKLAKVEAKANIQALYDKLDQELALNKQNHSLVLAGYIKDLYIADVNLRSSLSKEQRKKMVNSITATDSKGDVTVISAYVARDVTTANKITQDQKNALKVLELLDQINELHKSPTIFIPAWMGGSDKSELNTKTAQLELLLKEQMNMGAHYSEYEQARIKAIAPGTDITDLLYQHKIKSDALRDEVIAKLKRDKSVESFGEVGNTGAADQILRASQTNIKDFKGKRISN